MPSLATLLAVSAGVATVASAADAPQPRVVGFPFTKTKRHISERTSRLARRNTVQTQLENWWYGYQINVTVGTPGQSVGLQIDTGSSDTWFPYSGVKDCLKGGCTWGSFDPDKSSTFQDLAQGQFEISYVDGTEIKGDYIADTLDIGGSNIKNMTMALATSLANTDVNGGIMGIGYATDESIANSNPNSQYPNVPVQLLQQGYISSLAYSLWLNDLDSNFGSILFGGVDTAKYHGDLIAVPIVPEAKSGIYDTFTVALSSITVTNKTGKSVYNKPNLAVPVILDSGSTLTYLPNDLAMEILQGVGAAEDREQDWVLPCTLGDSGAHINFSFGGSGGPTIAVPFEDLFLPVYNSNGEQAEFKNGQKACQFGIYPAGNDPVIFGDVFLRSAYVVYDLHNNYVALANTNFNATDSNVKEISNTTIPGVTATASGVSVTQTATNAHRQGSSAAASATVSFVPGSATFDLGQSTSTAKGAAPASAQLPPRISLQLVMSGIAVVVAGMFGGSLMILC
ncbi:aspartic peptidase domain-containing protein [Phyllosticta capitalensis]|uniref:Aspartic peptidase domain-containing protein n=1 Tax=Phyllosticta capitalensis TaxID=121624 RepID=A0ABR1YGE9_9PEZI